MAASRRYQELLREAARLHRDKAAGYSGENPDTWSNFRAVEIWGIDPIMGVLVRMTDKWSRLQHLMKSPEADRVGESIFDTLSDLAAYALIARVLLEEQMLHDGTPEYKWDEVTSEMRDAIDEMVRDVREAEAPTEAPHRENSRLKTRRVSGV